jgi:hypothetical protein
MVIKTIVPRIHWNYFLAIERDVEVLSRYVEFDARNFDSFSIEIVRLILAAGSEIDVVCKQVCRTINPSSNANDINDYRNEIMSSFTQTPHIEVIVPRFGLSLHPWDEWRDAKNGVPVWWTAYNKVKHQRDYHYEKANLKNTLNAIAGLFVVVLYLYIDDAESGGLSPAPQLFRLHEKHTRPQSVIETIPCYKLRIP